MSMRLMVSVMDAKIGNKTQKLVLLKLADNADETTGECWPAYSSIAKQCEISRRTAIRAVKELVEKGILIKKGRKKEGGDEQTSNLYKINRSALGGSDTKSLGGDTKSLGGSDTKSLGGDTKSLGGSDTKSLGGDTKSPRTSHRTSKSFEPAIEHKHTQQAGVSVSQEAPKGRLSIKDLISQHNISPDLAAQFMQVRKAKRQALTPIAMSRIKSQADKAGMTLPEALEECCANGWAGFKASWMKNHKTESKHNNFERHEYTETVPDWMES